MELHLFVDPVDHATNHAEKAGLMRLSKEGLQTFIQAEESS